MQSQLLVESNKKNCNNTSDLKSATVGRMIIEKKLKYKKKIKIQKNKKNVNLFRIKKSDTIRLMVMTIYESIDIGTSSELTLHTSVTGQAEHRKT